MKYVGEIFKTNNYGNLIVMPYTNTRNVNVKFIQTGYETVAVMGDIMKGCERVCEGQITSKCVRCGCNW